MPKSTRNWAHLSESRSTCEFVGGDGHNFEPVDVALALDKRYVVSGIGSLVDKILLDHNLGIAGAHVGAERMKVHHLAELDVEYFVQQPNYPFVDAVVQFIYYFQDVRPKKGNVKRSIPEQLAQLLCLLRLGFC